MQVFWGLFFNIFIYWKPLKTSTKSRVKFQKFFRILTIHSTIRRGTPLFHLLVLEIGHLDQFWTRFGPPNPPKWPPTLQNDSKSIKNDPNLARTEPKSSSYGLFTLLQTARGVFFWRIFPFFLARTGLFSMIFVFFRKFRHFSRKSCKIPPCFGPLFRSSGFLGYFGSVFGHF